jgi:ATP-dependent DNA helicase RecG
MTDFYELQEKNYDKELISVLKHLIQNWEYEVVEFKEAGNDYDKNRIGMYFSAISNEANLKSLQYGWLVFGVRNKDKTIVGSNYRDEKGLDTLKQEISQETTGNISFIEIYEIYPVINNEKLRVIMFQIPAAVTATPTGWKGHFYGRDGESLGPLSGEEYDRIRGQEKKDWSKQLLEGSSINDINRDAVALARAMYKEKMNKQHISEEVDKMTDEDFLCKLKLMVNGRLTNAAMLLLGNEDKDYLFNSVPEASWRLYNSKNDISDYEIFKIPFITLSDRLFGRLRNLTYRYMPNQLTLFPQEISQYDIRLLRELLNNSIAHSEYTIGGRIYLNEFEDKIILSNPGSFLPGSIEPVLEPSYNPPFYRNQLLAETMVKLNMIDSQTMGIRRIFRIQQERYFPLPDYDFSNRYQVNVCVYGKTIDDNYMHLLYDNQNLDLKTVFLLDQVQKKRKIEKSAVTLLRKQKLIEGRINNLYISSSVAGSTEQEVEYIKHKAFDDQYYKDLIVKYLRQWQKAKKKDIKNLLWDKLPDGLNDKQKEYKIRTLLTSLKNSKVIMRDLDNQKLSSWILVE